MKGRWLGLALTASVLLAVVAFADAPKEKAKGDMAMSKAKPMMITGEIVDMGCYLADNERGEKHVSCATKCIAKGMPMGLLTADGKRYLMTIDHDDSAPYDKCKDWAAKQVTLTGTIAQRNGVNAIDVTAAQLAVAK